MRPDIAADFAKYLVADTIDEGSKFTYSEIRDYTSKIHGLSDNNKDLPSIKFAISRKMEYYPNQALLPEYKSMINSAICAAENVCDIEECTNLFAYENIEVARMRIPVDTRSPIPVISVQSVGDLQYRRQS